MEEMAARHECIRIKIPWLYNEKNYKLLSDEGAVSPQCDQEVKVMSKNGNFNLNITVAFHTVHIVITHHTAQPRIV